MSTRDKLVKRFLNLPKDFHFDELRRLLGYFGYTEVKRGKTSGSRIRFINSNGHSIFLHKPHPKGIIKQYQLKQVKELLDI